MDSYQRREEFLLYSLALMLILYVPGLMLCFAGSWKPMILPAWLVEALYPYAFFAPEKAFILDALNWRSNSGITAAELDSPELYDKQILVMALISFFATLVVGGAQAWAGALYSEPSLKTVGVAVLMTLVAMVFRADLIFVQLIHVGTAASSVRGFARARFFAPEGLILFTCFIALAICVVARFGLRLVALRD